MEGRERITVTEEGGLVRITASGISNHAAFPEGSVNAVNVLAQALSSSGVLERGTLEAAEGIAQMTADYYGAGCQIPFEDKESGSLTCVGSLVSTKDGIITVSFDIRYPVTVKGEEVLKDFEKAANGYGFTLKSSGQLDLGQGYRMLPIRLKLVMGRDTSQMNVSKRKYC